MSQSFRLMKLLAISAAAGILWGGGCLVEDFWVNKWSEVVNRLIFGAINAALGQPGPI